MAYGEKFKLEFSDIKGNVRKVSILKKNYTGSVYDLVGTADPVIIKWDADDDFYYPIIGSSCELNLFVTDSTQYDNWYEADEREYKVQVLTGTTFGAKVWDLQEDTFAEANFLWNEGIDGYEFYWEGFLIVDRYQEAVLSKPYPIRLIASDGLGQLGGVDAPLSNIVLSSGVPDESTNAQSNFDTAFYYITEILKLTGLDFDIRIANNIRATGFDSQETIFHEMDLYEFGLIGNNFKSFSAKKLLTKLLQFTNSRIFQANGSWHIISNSNIVDKRLMIDTTEVIPYAEDIFVTTRINTDTVSTDFIANDAANSSMTFSITQQPPFGTLTTTSTSFVYSPLSGAFGNTVFKYKANNGTNDSDPATVTIYVYQNTTAVGGATVFGNVYQGVSLTDAIAAATNASTTNRTTLVAKAQSKYLQSSGDIEWFQVQDDVGSISSFNDTSINGYFAIADIVPYQNLASLANDPNYALALNIRNGIVVERTEFGINFNGIISFHGRDKTYY